jgi:hypothetical protein
MDRLLFSRLSESHARRLAWFEDHKGETTGLPKPLDGGLRLVCTPKGIYKPRELDYALSIRINLDSPYQDGQVLPRPDGGWRLSYHQEGGGDSADRVRMFTNRGLTQCIEDRIPVGVLRAVEKAGKTTLYEVLGLALPVGWYEGYFLLESLGPEGDIPAGDTLGEILEGTAEASIESEAERAAVPGDDFDARLRALRQIVARRGQAKFRAALLQAYDGRCAVTGCDVEAVLDAAHIRPYRGKDSNVLANGLLLRTDIRTLLDLQLIGIDPDTSRVVIARRLQGTQYVELAGVQLAEPATAAQRPSRNALERAWHEFLQAEAAR